MAKTESRQNSAINLTIGQDTALRKKQQQPLLWVERSAVYYPLQRSGILTTKMTRHKFLLVHQG
jgi:hypothetical protein